MTEKEAIEKINNAIKQSKQIIVELTSIADKAEREGKVGEYYANLENCLKEIEACEIAVKALEEIRVKAQKGKNRDLIPVGELPIVIDKQPIICDLDRIVEQLNELRSECEDPLQDYCPEYFIDRAIEIVEAGGRE